MEDGLTGGAIRGVITQPSSINDPQCTPPLVISKEEETKGRQEVLLVYRSVQYQWNIADIDRQSFPDSELGRDKTVNGLIMAFRRYLRHVLRVVSSRPEPGLGRGHLDGPGPRTLAVAVGVGWPIVHRHMDAVNNEGSLVLQ